LINDAKSAAGSVVAKYAARASVAVPFVVAFGFATAAGTLMLVERFGHRDAYFMVAATFVVLGFLAALIVRAKEHEEIVADVQAGKTDTADVGTDAAAAAAVQMPLALLGALVSSPVGPASLMSLVRVVGRNLPLAAMLVGIGVLFWPKRVDGTGEGAPPEVPRPNGAYRPGVSRHAA
jgi:Na+/melibiose symporter-like transporter